MVKNLPAVCETWVWFLGWEDPLEEGIATYSSILAWRILMDRGAWQATVHGWQRVRYDSWNLEDLFLQGWQFLSNMNPLFLLFIHSVMSDSATPWTIAHQASLSFTISQSLLKFMSVESVIPSNHLILCHPLLLLPLIFSSTKVFKWVSSSQQVAKVLEFQL